MVAASLLSRRSRYGLLWYALAVLVATSRIHVRIHHASDVAGGALIGVALGGIARRITDRVGPTR
jgi:undecaprenyl-diphosphatase